MKRNTHTHFVHEFGLIDCVLVGVVENAFKAELATTIAVMPLGVERSEEEEDVSLLRVTGAQQHVVSPSLPSHPQRRLVAQLLLRVEERESRGSICAQDRHILGLELVVVEEKRNRRVSDELLYDKTVEREGVERGVAEERLTHFSDFQRQFPPHEPLCPLLPLISLVAGGEHCRINNILCVKRSSVRYIGDEGARLLAGRTSQHRKLCNKLFAGL